MPLPKAGLQAGDRLLLSRPREPACCSPRPCTARRGRPHWMQLDQMATSQHPLVEALQALDSQQPGLVTPPPISPASDCWATWEKCSATVAARGARRQRPRAAGPRLAGERSGRHWPAGRRAWAQLDDGSIDLNLSEIRSGSLRHQPCWSCWWILRPAGTADQRDGRHRHGLAERRRRGLDRDRLGATALKRICFNRRFQLSRAQWRQTRIRIFGPMPANFTAIDTFSPLPKVWSLGPHRNCCASPDHPRSSSCPEPGRLTATHGIGRCSCRRTG